MKAAAKDAIQGTALGDLHQLLTEKPPLEEQPAGEPREPIGRLVVEILGSSALSTLQEEKAVEAPFAQLQVLQQCGAPIVADVQGVRSNTPQRRQILSHNRLILLRR